MKPFEKILSQSKKHRKLIGIRLKDDEDDFELGFVEEFSDEIVQLRCVNTYGEQDGVVIRQISQIDSIDYTGDYIDAYTWLANMQNQDTSDYAVQFCTNGQWQLGYLNQALGGRTPVEFKDHRKEKTQELLYFSTV